MTNSHTISYHSLLPFITFVLLFVGTAMANLAISPLFICIVAIGCGLLTFARHIPFNKRMEIALNGSAQPTIIAMCYIFMFSAVFKHICKIIGGLEAATQLGIAWIEPAYILPGFFTIVSIFATAVGTSMGSIAAFLPIGMNIATTLGIDPALIAGVTVGAAMLGDNLSIISDTTIAAVQTVECRMQDKLKENIKLVIPAFLLTLAVLFFVNTQHYGNTAALPATSLGLSDYITILPYIIIVVAALLGIEVIAVLLLGIFSGMWIGIGQGVFSYTRASGLFLEGFTANCGGIQEVVLLVLLVAALSHIVEYNGGISYIVQKLSKKIGSKASAEWHTVLLVFLINAAVAINTIAILITGPVAKKIADYAGITRARIAALIDIGACICQGVLPYAPQLLLASSLSGVNPIAIMPHLHYQWCMLLVTLCSIIMTWIHQRTNSTSKNAA